MTIFEIIARLKELQKEMASIAKEYEALSSELFDLFLLPGPVPLGKVNLLKAFAKQMLAIFNELSELRRQLQRCVAQAHVEPGIRMLIAELKGLPAERLAKIDHASGSIHDAMVMHGETNEALEQLIVDAMRRCEGILRQMKSDFELAQ